MNPPGGDTTSNNWMNPPRYQGTSATPATEALGEQMATDFRQRRKIRFGLQSEGTSDEVGRRATILKGGS